MIIVKTPINDLTLSTLWAESIEKLNRIKIAAMRAIKVAMESINKTDHLEIKRSL